MTSGNIAWLLIKFAIPLLIGYLFQQMYSTVDLFVVGHYVNDSAYAAIGAVTVIINALIGFFMGLSAGAGVVISQYYGAGEEENASRAVHTILLMTLIMAVISTALGVTLTPFFLRLVHLSGQTYEEGRIYLTIYFAGVSGLMFYNTGAGILRAVGDSTRPFIFLVITAVLNTVLDIVFVTVIDLGVAGVAYATIASQIISAVLVIIVLVRSKSPAYKLYLKRLRIHRDMLLKIVRIGIPSAIQMAITSFSNVFVQSYIVDLGDAVLGGYTSYARIDGFTLLPVQSISLAATTFVGQNLGAGDVERAKKGTRTALLLSLAATLICIIPILIFAEQLAAIFNTSPAIVEAGALILRLMSPFYLFCCFNQIYAGVLRGAGAALAPMLIMLFSFVFLRQIYLFIIRQIAYSVVWVLFGYPLGWMVCSLLCYLYYRLAHWEKYRITGAPPKDSQPGQ
ncbi:MAG: MATE family efflux transporter [Clostridia bacterium]|nr:MATE family efflux transporter [Clostridia bacterium]